MKAGVIGKRKSKTGKGRTVLEPRDKVAFGRRVRGGQLVNPAGHALAGAKVLVYSQPREGTEQLEDTVTTNADGRFAYEVEARSSRRFRFVYQGTATILPVEDTATLLVEATSSFAVRPKHILNGDSVTFRGRVGDERPLPERQAGRVAVARHRGWQTFRTVRTDPMALGASHILQAQLRRSDLPLPCSHNRQGRISAGAG